MTKKDGVEVGCKILGLYALLQLAANLTQVVVPVSSYSGFLRLELESIVMFLAISLPLIVYLAAAYCLIHWASRVADILIGEEEEPTEEGGLDIATVEQIAFAAVGVFLIAGAIPYLPGSLIRIVAPTRFYNVSFADGVASLVALLVKMGIGLYLVLGARGLANLIHRLKSA